MPSTVLLDTQGCGPISLWGKAGPEACFDSIGGISQGWDGELGMGRTGEEQMTRHGRGEDALEKKDRRVKCPESTIPMYSLELFK